MSRDYIYLALIAFLWLHGGLGWASWTEASKKSRLTSKGRTIIVVFFPLMSLVSTIGMGIQFFTLRVVRPLTARRRRHIR